MVEVRKGIIFSIMTLMMALTVLTLAEFYATQTQRADINSEKTRGIFDDIRTDLETLWGVEARVSEGPSGREVLFLDRFPLEDGIALTSRYKDFVEAYSDRLNSEVKLDIGDSYFSMPPTGLVYGYPTYEKGEIRVYNASGDALGVEGYDLLISADKNFVNVTEDTAAGSLNVRLNATFPNGGYYREYAVSRSMLSTLEVNLQDSKVTIKLGNNTIDGVERNGSIVVKIAGNITPDIETTVRLGAGDSVGVRTNAVVSVGDTIDREDNIWLTPPTSEEAESSPPETTSTTTSTTGTTITTTTSTTTTTGSTGTTTTSTSTTTTTTTTTTASTTTTTTSTSTTTTTTMTCNGYCIGQGYLGGTCRQNQQQCTINETHEAEGDVYCTGGPSEDTCCCSRLL
ncbi:MAG: hypothetical protein V1744_04735 [Candidatus Altiarchaeota archaeon]